MQRALTECPSLEDQSQPTSQASPQTQIHSDPRVQIPPVHGSWRDRSLYSPWTDCSTTSPACISLASVWLDNCRRHHVPCRNFQGDGTFPRRIINISDPQRPVLEDGNGKEGDYITLSYKWGDCKRFVTTSRNIKQYQKEIPWQRLPWSFRDAINITHALGFQWIWIDALCILQDSTADLVSQINKMDLIFRSSVMTLYAAAGDSANSGLSVERDPRPVKTCMLELQTTLSRTTVKGQSLVMVDGYHDSYKPLFDRGWVLQEEVLAPRGLVFGQKQIAFRCVCGSCDETRPDVIADVQTTQDLGHRSSDLDPFHELRLWLLERDPLPDRTKTRRRNHFDHWYSMVKEYSSRSLTESADALRAVAGLANSFGKRHDCSYISGLWKEDLQVGLLWYVNDSDTGSMGTSLSVKFPSWSWAQVWGHRVSFLDWEQNHTLVTREGVQKYDGFGVVEPDTPNHLELVGRVRTARIGQLHQWSTPGSRDRYLHLRDARLLLTLHDPTTGADIGNIALDWMQDATPGNNLVHCLLTAAREKYGKWNLCCVAMVPTDDSFEVFRRVGIAHIHEEQWFGVLRLDEHVIPLDKVKADEIDKWSLGQLASHAAESAAMQIAGNLKDQRFHRMITLI